MQIAHVSITNLRRLASIEFDCQPSLNTIVGPNGIGKSSILDAIRLLKAVMLPTQPNEGHQTLQSMGVINASTGGIAFDTVAGNKQLPVSIVVSFCLTATDNTAIADAAGLAAFRLENRMLQGGMPKAAFTQYLGTREAQDRLEALQADNLARMTSIACARNVKVGLSISEAGMRPVDGENAEILAYLLSRAAYPHASFSVFPADRSFPAGDTAIQLGSADIQQHLQSHSMNPTLKFQRLKSALVSELMLNNASLSSIQEEFNLIFKELLPGRVFKEVKQDATTGRLGILISDATTGATFDIDFMSSGEKGLLLTLFLLRRTVSEGGIVLIDEPELHLNPAVSKRLIPFLREYVACPRQVQFVMTSHSAEVLRATQGFDNCLLLRLEDADVVSPIRKGDLDEAGDALRELGLDSGDMLFNRGLVFVEGEWDETVARYLLDDVLIGCQVRPLGGRHNVEEDIKRLVALDNRKRVFGRQVFVLDHDDAPFTGATSQNVRVIQWDRYSIENYLLEDTLLYDVLRRRSGAPPASVGKLGRAMKALAMGQIEAVAMAKAIHENLPPSIPFARGEIKRVKARSDLEAIAAKVEAWRKVVSKGERKAWIRRVEIARRRIAEDMQKDWKTRWKDRCRGKQLIGELIQKYPVVGGYAELVKEVLLEMKRTKRPEWEAMREKFSSALRD
jgi:predicted ATPase